MGQLLQPTSLENFLRKSLLQQSSSADSVDVNFKSQKEHHDKAIISDKPQSFFYNNDNNLEHDKKSLDVPIQRKNSENAWNKIRLIFQKVWDVKPYPLIKSTDILLVAIIFNDPHDANDFSEALFKKGIRKQDDYPLKINEDESKQFWTFYIPKDIYNKIKNDNEAYAKLTDGETRITDRISQKAESSKNFQHKHFQES